MPISAVQQSDSVVHIQTFFFIFFSIRILDVFSKEEAAEFTNGLAVREREAEATPRLLVWQQDEWSRHLLTRGPLPTRKRQRQPAPGPEVWGETWVRM